MGVKERQPLGAGHMALARRLRGRQGEIERALSHTCRKKNSPAVQDLKYCTEVNAALAAVTEFNFDCIESGDDAATPIPSAAVVQARRAARDGIALDTFLVEVIAAQTLLNEFILQEAGGMSGENLSSVQALQGSILLRFATELAAEYRLEEVRLDELSSRRLNALVERLLTGAPAPDREVGYNLERWHLGLVVSGGRAMEAARVLAESLGTALLAAPREEGMVWAWLGSSRKVAPRSVQDALTGRPRIDAKVAVGEPGREIEGWRSTHFEAKAAFGVAIHTPVSVTCFSDVALEAIALQMPDLMRSLQAAYLAPLAGSKRRGVTLRQTLRAYFEAGRNASSAAVSLRVSRRTVENRLRLIEQKLGRPLPACGAELELALRLEELTSNGS
ncbi:MAG TPA: helix-turn-helix domain-containing protein [Solirubrobacterales bacterium]|nr:helix-turn-helix domain-containing protein [Solirubrobacterales bacterium]